MPTTHSRSSRVPDDAGLRLPRPPGVLRQFWARHPLFADILIALACLLTSVGDTAARAGSAPAVPLSIGIGLLALAGAAALLVRRRLPLLPFALAVTLALTTIAAPHGGAIPLLIVSTYGLAVYGSTRLCLFAGIIGAVLVGTSTAVATLLSAPADTLPAALKALVNTGAVMLLGGLVGVNVGNRRRWIEAVLARSRQLLVERDQQAELAAAAERERIAREMHDIVSHSLTVIVALTEGAGATADRERAREATDAAAATARQALNEMRAMLGVLRARETSTPLAPLSPTAPYETVSAAQRAGFPATLTVTGDDHIPAPVAYAVGRIVQEGVTNAIRHAPDATSLVVHIDYRADEVAVRIVNDGLRPATAAPGFGIQGLTERTARLGGTLHSAPSGARWLLEARLPLPDSEPDPEPDPDPDLDQENT